MNYKKDLNEQVRLRLSVGDMRFLKDLSAQRCITISELIRSIIGEYRRAVINMDYFKQAVELAQKQLITGKGKGEDVHGDTKTDSDH